MMRWIVGPSQKHQRLVLAVAVDMMAFVLVQLRSTSVQVLLEFVRSASRLRRVV